MERTESSTYNNEQQGDILNMVRTESSTDGIEQQGDNLNMKRTESSTGSSTDDIEQQGDVFNMVRTESSTDNIKQQGGASYQNKFTGNLKNDPYNVTNKPYSKPQGAKPFYKQSGKTYNKPYSQPYQPSNRPSGSDPIKKKFDPKKPNPPTYLNPQKIIDLSVYAPDALPCPKATNPALYVPHYTQGFGLPQASAFGVGCPNAAYGGIGIPSLYGQASIPVPTIIKNVNVNANGPYVSHSVVDMIYANKLTKKNAALAMTTVKERQEVRLNVKAVLLRHHEGEILDLGNSQNKGAHILTQFIKYKELNPYRDTSIRNNLYNLPQGMLIYSSCYPIMLNETNNTVECSENSVGISIKIYRLKLGELSFGSYQEFDDVDFDVWREIRYYKYMRDEIIDKFVCPNFVSMHTFMQTTHSGINFDEIEKIQIRCGYFLPGQIRNIQKIGPVHKVLAASAASPNKVDVYKYTDAAVIALTEAPNYTIYSWGSKAYYSRGTVLQMTNTGFHKPEVWLSVFFQLFSAMYTLQLHKIYFNGFKLEENVFIKEIEIDTQSNKYWVYSVNGINYYIPNYGFLVLVDTTYKDIEKPPKSVNGSSVPLDFPKSPIVPQSVTNFERHDPKFFKIWSNMYRSQNEYDPKEIDAKCFEAFVDCINPNNYSLAFANKGGVEPSAEVKKLLANVYSEARQSGITDIGHYIEKFMKRYLHNKVGLRLTEEEIKNIRDTAVEKPLKGTVVVYQINVEDYRFGIIQDYLDDGQINILTRDTKNSNLTNDLSVDNFEVKTITSDQLFTYESPDGLDQKPGKEGSFNMHDRLEIYKIN